MCVEVYFNVGEYQDSMIVEGETLDEIRQIVDKELKKRGATYLWAKKLEN